MVALKNGTGLKPKPIELGGTTLLVEQELYTGAHVVATPSAEPSGRTAEVSVTLPAQAVLDSATATVSAGAPGRTPLSGIAQVRSTGDDPSAAGTSLVVDFGGFCTLSGLDLPAALQGVQTWTGVAFAALAGVSISVGRATFAGEVMATKLRVTFGGAVSPAAVQSGGFATLPAVPTGLTVSVDGATVWRSDPALVLVKGSAQAQADVDLTAVLRAAVGEADRVVTVALQADQPGVLSVTVTAPLLLTHEVALAPAPLVVEAREEGDHPLTLTLPAPATGWQMHHVVCLIDAEPGDERVLPEVGPPPSANYALTVVPGQPLVVRLADAPRRRLEHLTGVRVALLAGSDGAEVAGVLLAGDGLGGPGAPLDGGALSPSTLPPSLGGATAGWVTLALPRPLPVPGPTEELWLSLQVARGLVQATVAAPSESAADDAALYRQTPTGAVVPLSHIRALPPPLASVRLVGRAPEQAPLAPARLLLGADTAAELSPGASVTLSPATPVAPTPSSQAGDAPTFGLVLRVAAPGTYTVRSVRLVYQEAGT
jgi:hypothetical protein